MALLSFALLVFPGCDGGGTTDSKDTAADDTGGGDTQETDDTEETGEEPTYSASGSVIDWTGAALAGARIQFCDLLCYTTESEGDGSFVVEGVKTGTYKIDVDGFSIGSDYGYGRYPAGTITDANLTLAWPAMVPQAGETKTISNGEYVFGGTVSWTIDSSIIDLPLGYDTYDFTVGLTEGATIPAWWTPQPAFAVTFLPFGSEVAGSFDLSVTGAYPDGAYNVYAVGSHGELESIGTATGSGGVVSATGLAPEILTWVVFVQGS